MAKIYGLFGSMTGKLADVVMAVRYGEQVARKYQPIVSNPSSPAQVEQRAKLKLLSQLSAVVAPVIAIPRRGSVSSRNLFTKKNFPAVTYANNEADVTLTAIKLTDSVVGLPTLNADRTAEGIAAYLTAGAVAPDVARVVYVMLAKQADESLRYVSSQVISAPGNDNSFYAEFPLVPEGGVILAYGVRDNTDAARATFGELTAPLADTVAKIIVTRTLTEADVTLTETRGATFTAATTTMVAPADENRSKKK